MATGTLATRGPQATLVSPYIDLDVRDFTLNLSDGSNPMPASLAPSDAKALLDGEWMELSAKGQVTRAGWSNNTTGVAESTVPCWMVYGEKGRSDLQAIGKVPLIWRGSYEMDTRVFDGTLAIGGSVTVKGVVTDDGTKFGDKQVSALADGATAKWVVGIVTAAPASGIARVYVSCSGYGLQHG